MPAPKFPQPVKTRHVFTVDPKKTGDPVPQAPLTTSNSLVPIDAAVPMVDRPKAKYMDSGFSNIFDVQRVQKTVYRWSDLLALSLFSEQYYYDAEAAKPLIAKALGDCQLTRYKDLGEQHVGWDEWSINGQKLLVFGGYTDPNLWTRTDKFSTMYFIIGEPLSFRFWGPLVPTFLALEGELLSHYSDLFHQVDNGFILTGHDYGGSMANWFSYRINHIADTYSPQKTPMLGCCTFGAPALFTDESGDADFRADNKHYRCVRFGDPIPGITQFILRAAGYDKQRPSTALDPLPRHYSSRDIGADGKDAVFFKQYDLANDYMGLATTNPSQRLDKVSSRTGISQLDYEAAHSIKAYTGVLIDTCRREADTPYPSFPHLLQWADLLNTPSFPVR
jgi:hypothetical protein